MTGDESKALIRLLEELRPMVAHAYDREYEQILREQIDEAVAKLRADSPPMRFKEWWPQFVKDHPRIARESAYEESIALHAWTAARHFAQPAPASKDQQP